MKRDLARAQAKIATLERDLSTSNKRNREMEAEMTEQRGKGEVVRAQRDLILKGEANERGRGEEREAKFAEDTVSSPPR
jgi:multidrug resistance efflux pump